MHLTPPIQNNIGAWRGSGASSIFCWSLRPKSEANFLKLLILGLEIEKIDPNHESQNTSLNVWFVTQNLYKSFWKSDSNYNYCYIISDDTNHNSEYFFLQMKIEKLEFELKFKKFKCSNWWIRILKFESSFCYLIDVNLGIEMIQITNLSEKVIQITNHFKKVIRTTIHKNMYSAIRAHYCLSSILMELPGLKLWYLKTFFTNGISTV